MKRSAVVLLVLLSCLVPQVASAITYGEADAGRHPNVGSFIAEGKNKQTGETELWQLCTGTLIDDDVVVSASHCFYGEPADSKVYFTLDPVIDADKDGLVDPTVHRMTGTPVVNPKYQPSSHANNTYDVAVFLLDQPVKGVTPAPLPRQGLLESRTVQKKEFVTVGYGTTRESRKQGAQAFGVGWRRETTTQHFSSLTKAWVTFSMNQAHGDGGTCYGDSGGPHFRGATIVAVTVTGDSMCKATDKDYRLDTSYSRDFLGQFVTLP